MKKNVISSAILAFILTFIIYGYAQHLQKFRELDAKEMNFDADGPFILVNITDGTIGYYIADEPQKHITHEIVNIPEDWVYYLGDGQTEIDDIKWLMENVPAGTPIAFYEEE